MFFYNRKKAGEKLAKILAKKYSGKDIVVYALPRGGVVTGIEISKVLHAPLDVIITRKIGHPRNPEYALAVLSEDGHIVGNEGEIKSVDSVWFQKEVEKEKQEILRRRNLYLKGRKIIDAKDKIAIIIDDGIATGLTMKAAIEDIKYRDPKEIVIAIPVIPKEVFLTLKPLVDEIIALKIDENYLGAVGSYYIEFPQITDEEVVRIL